MEARPRTGQLRSGLEVSRQHIQYLLNPILAVIEAALDCQEYLQGMRPVTGEVVRRLSMPLNGLLSKVKVGNRQYPEVDVQQCK
jgi:hypothetical protein